MRTSAEFQGFETRLIRVIVAYWKITVFTEENRPEETKMAERILFSREK
jgi:hypothetical protein